MTHNVLYTLSLDAVGLSLYGAPVKVNHPRLNPGMRVKLVKVKEAVNELFSAHN